MGANKVLPKAKAMADENHVHNINYSDIDDECDHGFYKALVLPSLPSKDASKTPDYPVWICVSKATGHIHSALCGCTAG